MRQPVFVVSADPTHETVTLLLNISHPAYAFLSNLPVGATVDVLGPLGKGWQIDEKVRTLALIGTADTAPALFSLAHNATSKGVAVTVLLGVLSRDDAPPPFLLPAAAEYNVAQSKAFASAAISLLDDQLLRWADMLAIALPHEYWAKVAQRVNNVRIRWSRGFAQVAVLPPLACFAGVCGVCSVETQHTVRLACIDGPVFDLQDLVR
jgi:dihydroorotate dehydrogenase electron transfer subunit